VVKAVGLDAGVLHGAVGVQYFLVLLTIANCFQDGVEGQAIFLSHLFGGQRLWPNCLAEENLGSNTAVHRQLAVV
jgi:hypothetical protein